MSKVVVSKKYALKIGNKQVVDYVFDKIISMDSSYVGIINEDGKYRVEGYSSKDGKKVLDQNKIKKYIVGKKYVILYVDSGFAYIYFDNNGKKTITNYYTDIKAPTHDVIVVDDSSCNLTLQGAYSSDGKHILSTQFDEIIPQEDYIFVKHLSAIGVYSHDGKKILDTKYKNIIPIKDAFLVQELDDEKKIGIFSLDGKEMLMNCCENVEICYSDKLPYIKFNLLNNSLYYLPNLKKVYSEEFIQIDKCNNGKTSLLYFDINRGQFVYYC